MHQTRTRTISIVALLSLCMVSTGCTSLRTVPRPHTAREAQAAGINPGDRIILQMKSGESRSIRVTSVEEDGLASKDGKILFADIERVQRRQVREMSLGRTAAIIGGVAVVAGAVWYAAMVERGKNSD